MNSALSISVLSLWSVVLRVSAVVRVRCECRALRFLRVNVAKCFSSCVGVSLRAC